MNSAEQTVTWLITLGVLESPKKNISDPEGFLQSSLKDGVVLCRLLDRLRPGCIEKTFDANDLYQGQNFSKVLNSLVALNKVTAGCDLPFPDIGVGSDSVCARHSSSHRIKSFDSLGSQSSLSRTSKLFQSQYRSLDMTDNSNHQLVVKARFNFQQTNEDELSFAKGEIIHVLRKPVSPKSATLKSPPKGFDTSAISKTYYNVVLQNILETESEYAKELQNLLSNYLRSLQATDNPIHFGTPAHRRLRTYYSGTVKATYLACLKVQIRGFPKTYSDYHPDRPDIQKSMTTFKSLSAQCQEVRKRKELELQILAEAIRCWEGEGIKTLGTVLYMSQVMIQCAGSEVKQQGQCVVCLEK
ncbi:UNVERIFIED_CONTAM: hypothetical protein FKN15_074195 [Acipenser sinensis]